MALTSGKRVVLRVEEVAMKDLKKDDKFFVIEDGVIMNEGRLLVADADGIVNEKGVGAVEAHII
jgi:hypothetical protein